AATTSPGPPAVSAAAATSAGAPAVGAIGVLAAGTTGRPAAPSGVGTAVALTLVPLALALVAFGVLIPDWMEQFRFATPVWTLGPFVMVLAGIQVLTTLRWRGRVIVTGVTAV